MKKITTKIQRPKIATAQTWPCRVSDYQTQNNQWTITLLSHISLYATVLVFLHSDQLQRRKSNSKNSKCKGDVCVFLSLQKRF